MYIRITATMRGRIVNHLIANRFDKERVRLRKREHALASVCTGRCSRRRKSAE